MWGLRCLRVPGRTQALRLQLANCARTAVTITTMEPATGTHPKVQPTKERLAAANEHPVGAMDALRCVLLFAHLLRLCPGRDCSDSRAAAAYTWTSLCCMRVCRSSHACMALHRLQALVRYKEGADKVYITLTLMGKQRNMERSAAVARLRPPTINRGGMGGSAMQPGL